MSYRDYIVRVHRFIEPRFRNRLIRQFRIKRLFNGSWR